MSASTFGWAASLATLLATTTASPATGSRGGRAGSIVGRRAVNGTDWACADAREAARGLVGSRIQPSIALACLASVPVDVENDMELMEYLGPTLELHSTLGYMKKPPRDWLFPSVDLPAGIQQIKSKLAATEYRTQLEFAWDLDSLYNQVYDGHLEYRPALLSVFGFQAGRSLVSVSRDGLEAPRIYDEADMLEMGDCNIGRDGTSIGGYTPSEVVRIDGTDAVEYLEIVAASGGSHDPDAQYNNLFGSAAVVARGGGRFFRSGGYVELPDYSVYEYANGSSAEYPNFAVARQDLSGIDTGVHLHLAYELPRPQSEKEHTEVSKPHTHRKGETTRPATPTKTGASAETTATDAQGYPPPVAKHYNDYVAGYFLDGAEHSEVAVLSAWAFSPKYSRDRTETELPELRRAVRSFFAQCRAANRTKLVIDVSANGGGYLFQAYELFKNLFPQTYPFDGTRIRHTPAWNVIGSAVYGTSAERSVLNNLVDEDLRRFDSWQALFVPLQTPEDTFSSLLRYDFTNPDTAGEGAFLVSGFDPDDDQVPHEAPFRVEDMVLVTDGFCGSTCSILARLLTEQGVRTLAVGGRPLKAPMQAVGGTKGAQVLQYAGVQRHLTTALLTAAAVPPGLPVTDEQPPLLPGLDRLRFNFRNAYRNASATTPQQFVYEAANCRRFYTWDMTRDQARVWAVAADVAFGGAPCVEGSSLGPGGTMDVRAPALNRTLVASRIPPYEGPGSEAYAEFLAGGGSRCGGGGGNTTTVTVVETVVVVEKVPAVVVETVVVKPAPPGASSLARRRLVAARQARKEDMIKALSEHERELLDRNPIDHESQGWWDHPGY